MTPAIFTLFPDEPRERVQDWIDSEDGQILMESARGVHVSYTADDHGEIKVMAGGSWVGSWEEYEGVITVRIDR
jgi:hypothetical protein